LLRHRKESWWFKGRGVRTERGKAEQILGLKAKGKGVREIARELGCSHVYVIKVLREVVTEGGNQVVTQGDNQETSHQSVSVPQKVKANGDDVKPHGTLPGSLGCLKWPETKGLAAKGYGLDMETGEWIPAKPDGTVETKPAPGYYWWRGARRRRTDPPSWEDKGAPAEYHIDQHPMREAMKA
jgi:hypothetical protein